MDKKWKFSKAFSLTELMLVLSIMAILSGLIQVNIRWRKQEAEVKNIVECVKIYEAALQMYYLHNNGKFPDKLEDEQRLEDNDDLKPFQPINFNTDNLIKSESCSGICYYVSDGKIGIKVNFNENKTVFIDKIEKKLKKHCIDSQVSSGTSYLYYYLKDGSGIIYI